MFSKWLGNEDGDRKGFEKERLETLSSVQDDRCRYEVMMQRFKAVDGTPASSSNEDIEAARVAVEYCTTVSQDVLSRLDAIEKEVNDSEYKSHIPLKSQIESLKNLADAAVEKGELRAYICPCNEVSDEGRLSIDAMEEWNVPKSITSKLRDVLGEELRETEKFPRIARSALRAIYDEMGSWSGYTTEYEETMKKYAKTLFFFAVSAIFLSFLSLHYQIWRVVGLLLSGVAGSCFSVLVKMPTLEVRPSGELDAYVRTIFCRLGIGISASVIGCGLLVWGLIPIQDTKSPFSEILLAPSSSATCSDQVLLILLAVPMLLGFFERPLTWFQEKLLGK